MDLRWLTILGLFFDLIGAFFLAYGLIVSKEQAIELGIEAIPYTDDEETLKLPPVKDRLRQSRNAKIGLLFLASGFSLQIVGSWPRAI